MPTLGNPHFNWNAPNLKHEYIRWNSIVKDNFKVNETKETHKASHIRGWIDYEGT